MKTKSKISAVNLLSNAEFNAVVGRINVAKMDKLFVNFNVSSIGDRKSAMTYQTKSLNLVGIYITDNFLSFFSKYRTVWPSS